MLLLAAASLVACGRDQPPGALVGVQILAPGSREEMPPIVGTTLTGTELSLADLRGRVVVLNSWASWCGPCRTETPALVDLADGAAATDVAVIGLNVKDDPAAATEFVAELGIDYPSIVDADGSLLRTIPGVPPAALPSTVVLDRSGAVAARFVGEVDATELADVVASLVAEPAA